MNPLSEKFKKVSNDTNTQFENIERHAQEIALNRRYWDTKPLLRSCYHSFYRALKSGCNQNTGLPTLELGSGIGAIKEVIPECITSDIFDHSWLDRRESAYSAGFPDASLGNVILFDVFHHLEFPGTALAEMARVVTPGGRLLIFEPDMSLLGRVVYGIFHPEPLGFGKVITWSAPDRNRAESGGYYAAQGNATRIFRHKEFDAWETNWKMLEMQRIVSLRYFGSGGFAGPQLLPSIFEIPLKALEKALTLIPSLFSARLLLILERK